METLHNINIIRDSSNGRAWGRLPLALVGIIAAIIGLFTLLSEVRSSAHVATSSQLVEVFKIVHGDFSVEAASVNLVTALWPL